MKFENLSGRSKVIYECMWGEDKRLPMDIEPNGASYKISGEAGENGEAIQRAFNISNIAAFVPQYKKAISGNGNEAEKIMSLHSSSRLALLVFYNLKEKPITLNIDGTSIVFDYSTFEFKNPVIGYPSNMDIVLLSKDRRVVLFLESKFSEYYMSASKSSSFISKRYMTDQFSGPIYAQLIGTEIGCNSETMTYTDNTGKEKTRDGFTLYMKDGSDNYLDGIKQIISHYVGIRRRLRGTAKDVLKADNESPQNREISEEVLSALRRSDSKIYLGEILFDGFFLPKGCEGADPTEIYRSYSKLYEMLDRILNSDIKKNSLESKFKVLETDLKYTDVIRDNKEQIDPAVVRFYGIED